MSEVLSKSALQLAKDIKSGKHSCSEVVEAHIQHINRVNKHLNAMVHDRFDTAIAEARHCDEQLQSMTHSDKDALPVFYGVPIAIKECFDVQGYAATGGLHARFTGKAHSLDGRAPEAKESGILVKRLQDAGCIILGITNVSELCMWMECYNTVYGRTNNPYDLSLTSGGSSGGQGALIAACGAPLGLGNDIGGSIRMPAFFNGIFGHKPTGGAVTNEGSFPTVHGQIDTICQPGPMCRHVEDVWPMLTTLLDQDHPLRSEDPSSVDVSKLVVLSLRSLRSPIVSPVDVELLDAQQRVADHMAETYGCTVLDVEVPDFRYAFDMWSCIVDEAQPVSFTTLLRDGKSWFSLALELAKVLIGWSHHTFPAVVLAIVEHLHGLLPARNAAFRKRGQRLRTQLSKVLSGECSADDIKAVKLVQRRGQGSADAHTNLLCAVNGKSCVLLMPSHPVAAPTHDWPLLRPFNWVYTGVLNVLRLPATQVPLGLSSPRGPYGLARPLGVQIVAAPNQDHQSIAVAQVLSADGLAYWSTPTRTYLHGDYDDGNVASASKQVRGAVDSECKGSHLANSSSSSTQQSTRRRWRGVQKGAQQ